MITIMTSYPGCLRHRGDFPAFKFYTLSLFPIQKLFQNWISTRRFPGLTFPTYMTTTVQSPVCLVCVNWRFMTSQKLNISVTWTIAVKPLLPRAKFYGQVCEVKEISCSLQYYSCTPLFTLWKEMHTFNWSVAKRVSHYFNQMINFNSVISLAELLTGFKRQLSFQTMPVCFSVVGKRPVIRSTNSCYLRKLKRASP